MRLIDADALKKELSEFNYGMALRIVDTQPTIEPEVRHGRWMFHEQKNGYLWKCSNCKGNFDQQFSYCPHCGARMGG